ncbi:hypothetical protein DESUT3_34190 [Desulfuromonas versatilis]|uniref:DAGKc domain-containing protein n=1 Tax=Desulfuromonas versatilis TaxID=2802975 RepID=A0ABM8HWN5_9BACT|nr:diacylglycerol kinase family protein [Desulfuromonas versatilis]BCR06350.1 hypothetical protein DESUT3_34190 [Desulfuromonas versatilis]
MHRKNQGRIRLIANPIAGGNARQKIDQAAAWLRRQGREVEVLLTGARGDAREFARQAPQAGCDLVIAAGGDGTLNEVINGLAPSAIPLAFIPLGTTNVFALEVGIPFDIEAACRIALEGEPRPVCLGLAGDTRFLLMAGVGFDADAVFRVSSKLKRRTGKFAYLVSAVSALLAGPFAPIEVETEQGERLRGYNLVVGNGRFYGGRFSITPGASLYEDTLEACLFLRPGRLRFLGSALKIALGARLPAEEARIFKTRHLEVAGAGLAVQIDGDFHGRLPMTIRALPGELRMVLPTGA